MTTPPPGQPGQPSAPGNPFGAQGQPLPEQPGQPVYGQPTPAPTGAYGAGPGQPFAGQPQPGQPQPGGFPPVPQPPRQSQLKRILIPIGVLAAVIVVGIVATQVFKDKDSGTSVDSSPVGSCITVSSTDSSMNVETKKADCDDTSTFTYIVGATLGSSDECKNAGYDSYVYEYGSGASDNVSCLIPNYQRNSCYKENSISMGMNLETVSCSETSSMMTAIYEITERADSSTAPNCTDSAKQKQLNYQIRTDPAKSISFCAEIKGDYTWQ
ncbi:hypothetical protein nbrc107696_36710 [Gordonia spumicola]|uniref:Uncharacterized protein n=1 Tax=Gordonia spumicola TaxID=589161 RepID=A0A7I9VCZ1_9ACTN|nr:hypothetical protein [Gordonia spumicola]GEE03225.1 hypothetical protein nbrc107696_36710 [Gordonia spumicola]